METETVEELAQTLEADLMAKYGPLLSGNSLREVLGYRSMDAMRQAVLRGTIPIPIFSIKHRRGKFALIKDVANWLADIRNSAPNRVTKFSKGEIKEGSHDLA